VRERKGEREREKKRKEKREERERERRIERIKTETTAKRETREGGTHPASSIALPVLAACSVDTLNSRIASCTWSLVT
jgi:hypothetical protein